MKKPILFYIFLKSFFAYFKKTDFIKMYIFFLKKSQKCFGLTANGYSIYFPP